MVYISFTHARYYRFYAEPLCILYLLFQSTNSKTENSKIPQIGLENPPSTGTGFTDFGLDQLSLAEESVNGFKKSCKIQRTPADSDKSSRVNELVDIEALSIQMKEFENQDRVELG